MILTSKEQEPIIQSMMMSALSMRGTRVTPMQFLQEMEMALKEAMTRLEKLEKAVQQEMK